MTASTDPQESDDDLLCDNFLICRSYVFKLNTLTLTLAVARARGWHVFDGTTIGGADVKAVLCPMCVGQRNRLAAAPALLPGQEELFDATE